MPVVNGICRNQNPSWMVLCRDVARAGLNELGVVRTAHRNDFTDAVDRKETTACCTANVPGEDNHKTARLSRRRVCRTQISSTQAGCSEDHENLVHNDQRFDVV
jgi:hypothetical protein